ncbi:MAG: hypothetical protein M3O61_20215 [Gemmatimonadota bacterium]|nr:hypothetical protein [Gemmatimonadota bacterium]
MFGQQEPHLAAMAGKDDRFPAAAMMPGSDVAGVAALLEELFDHAQRNHEPVGDLFAGNIPPVIGLEDALTEID